MKNNDEQTDINNSLLNNDVYQSEYDLDDYGDEEIFQSELSFRGLNILITYNLDESKKNIYNDYEVLKNTNIDSIILEKLIPWLKGQDYIDMDNQKILNSLKLYEITYTFQKICETYSPIGKEAYFGRFDLDFESDSEYTDNLLQAVRMEIYIHNNKIVDINYYDL